MDNRFSLQFDARNLAVSVLLIWSSLLALHFALTKRYFETVAPQNPLPSTATFTLCYLVAATLISLIIFAITYLLHKSFDQAESAKRHSFELLGTKSYELRTPLNNIIGAIEMLEERDLDARFQRQVKSIKESAYALSKVLNLDSTFRSQEIERMLAPQAPLTADLLEKEESSLKKIEEPTKIFALVVEDNKMSQEITVFKLTKAGFKVEVANDGQEAVSKAKQNSFDFILMDCQMPGMDGFEATRQIREYEQQSKSRRVPIVALTAHASEDYKATCLQAGMDDYLTKPIKQQELIRFVGRFLIKMAKEQGLY